MNAILRKTAFAALFMAIGGAAAFTTQAVAGQGRQGGRFGGCLTELVESLNLTDDQKADLMDLRTTVADRMSDLRDDHQGTMRLVTEAMKSDDPDREALHKSVDQRMDARAKAVHETVDDVLDFYDGLDATQKETLRARIETMGQHQGQGRGRFGGAEATP